MWDKDENKPYILVFFMPLHLPKTPQVFSILVSLSKACSQQYGKQIEAEKGEGIICRY